MVKGSMERILQSAFFAESFLHSIALSADFDQVCVVQETAEDGGSGWHISDEFAPFFQGTV